ncbi:tetratricopeptide repeat protein [Hahella ganghwensis]|uniref:tetratricopeptide repeat protein n=1 Tax=Hahella ganghwensis TaxID=286420 RepID=UPI00036ED05A|nr:tetratricopeptide repeat protein [Hahella ganghwensis]
MDFQITTPLKIRKAGLSVLLTAGLIVTAGMVVPGANATVIDFGPGVGSADESAIVSGSDAGALSRDDLIELGLFYENQMEDTAGDLAALKYIANLLKIKDKRVSLALANYIKKYPNDPHGYHLAAIQLLLDKKFKEAEVALQHVLDSFPKNTGARTLLGIAMLSRGAEKEGIDELKLAIREGGNSPLTFRYLAWSAMRSHNLEQARNYLEQALLRQGVPGHTATLMHLELAELHRQLGEHDRIVLLFQPMVDNQNLSLSDNFNAEAVVRYLEAAVEVKYIEGAEKARDKLAKVGALNNFPGQMANARLLALNGKYDESVAELGQLSSKVPELEQRRYLALAKVHAQFKKSDMALEALRKYLGSFGSATPISAVETYVQIAKEIGKGNQALMDLEEWSEQNTKSHDLKVILAQTYFEAGDYTQAMSVTDKILASDPDHASAHYIRGVLYYNRHENQAAVEAFQKAVDSQPTMVEAWMGMAGALHDHRTHSHAQANASAGHEQLIPMLKKLYSITHTIPFCGVNLVLPPIPAVTWKKR